ncbi:PAS domain-containing protein [Fischerella muscicola]|nr:PAS domain-containing protein [Fischerella muscicola]
MGCKALFGLPKDTEMSYQVFLDALHPEDRQRIHAMRPLLESGQLVHHEIEYRVVWPDGTVHWIAARGSANYDADGKPISSMGVIFDITDRKQIEAALRQNEERLRVALQASPITVFTQDRELRYTWVYNPTPAFANVDLIGKQDADLLPAQDVEILTQIKRQVLETGIGTRKEVKTTQKGQPQYYDLTVEPQRQTNGEILGVICAAVNITRLKQTELALRQSETILKAFIASSPIGMAFFDRDLRYVYANEALATINGIPLEQHLGRTLGDILPQWAPIIEPIFQQVMATKEPLLNQEVVGATNPADVVRHSLVNYFPVCLPDGEVIGLGVTDLDISDRRQAEEALRRSEEEFRTIANAAPALVWVTLPNGDNIFFNDRWYEFTGQTQAEAAGYGWTETIHPDDAARILPNWQRCQETGETYEGEVRYRRYDGEYRWHAFRALPRYDANGQIEAWYGLSIDISDRKIAEAAVQESERRLRRLVESNMFGVAFGDFNGGN